MLFLSVLDKQQEQGSLSRMRQMAEP